jgi:hypothetical protein
LGAENDKLRVVEFGFGALDLGHDVLRWFRRLQDASASTPQGPAGPPVGVVSPAALLPRGPHVVSNACFLCRGSPVLSATVFSSIFWIG